MKISEAFDKPTAAMPNGSDGDYFVSGYQEPNEPPEYWAFWNRYYANRERNYTGPYCHRCRAKVDQRRPEGSFGVYETFDRGTDQLHRLRCFDRRYYR